MRRNLTLTAGIGLPEHNYPLPSQIERVSRIQIGNLVRTAPCAKYWNDVKACCEYVAEMGKHILLLVPLEIHKEDLVWLFEIIQAVKSNHGCRSISVLCNSLGAISALKNEIYDVEVGAGDFLRCSNAQDIEVVRNYGAKWIRLSPELSINEIELLLEFSCTPLEIIVHGMIPLGVLGKFFYNNNKKTDLGLHEKSMICATDSAEGNDPAESSIVLNEREITTGSCFDIATYFNELPELKAVSSLYIEARTISSVHLKVVSEYLYNGGLDPTGGESMRNDLRSILINEIGFCNLTFCDGWTWGEPGHILVNSFEECRIRNQKESSLSKK